MAKATPCTFVGIPWCANSLPYTQHEQKPVNGNKAAQLIYGMLMRSMMLVEPCTTEHRAYDVSPAHLHVFCEQRDLNAAGPDGL